MGEPESARARARGAGELGCSHTPGTLERGHGVFLVPGATGFFGWVTEAFRRNGLKTPVLQMKAGNTEAGEKSAPRRQPVPRLTSSVKGPGFPAPRSMWGHRGFCFSRSDRCLELCLVALIRASRVASVGTGSARPTCVLVSPVVRCPWGTAFLFLAFP